MIDIKRYRVSFVFIGVSPRNACLHFFGTKRNKKQRRKAKQEAERKKKDFKVGPGHISPTISSQPQAMRLTGGSSASEAAVSQEARNLGGYRSVFRLFEWLVKSEDSNKVDPTCLC